ncbi:DUF465 domain-containing protein [Lentilitoribacter sp. Alg239-R112]|uniref:YdcH family protein n=1 Tax=Lentilitoribacter sp. Alg239-R112 TaxID=2305987 RepID=UPI0013A6F648|nr:DUF465 domain-containing protein [Lentilitoribacter sp. Alg239-R112]
MSSEAHLASLEEKHHALEAELDTLMNSPRPQEELVIDLKRRKLKLKDRIEQFRSTKH